MHLTITGPATITLCLAAAAPAATIRPQDALLLLDPLVLGPAVNSDLSASGEAPAGPPSQGVAALEDLKEAYLRCERAALTSALSGEEAMACSILYEELKRTGFGGNAGRLREWSAPLLGLHHLAEEGEV